MKTESLPTVAYRVCVWNLKLKFQSILKLCPRNYAVCRWTDRVNPVYPPPPPPTSVSWGIIHAVDLQKFMIQKNNLYIWDLRICVNSSFTITSYSLNCNIHDNQTPQANDLFISYGRPDGRKSSSSEKPILNTKMLHSYARHLHTVFLPACGEAFLHYAMAFTRVQDVYSVGLFYFLKIFIIIIF